MKNIFTYLLSLQLAKPLPQRSDIKPITSLPTFDPFDGVECVVSGWGIANSSSYTPTVSKSLRFSDVFFVSNEKCQKRVFYQLPQDTLCAVGGGRPAGACGSTQSGDPLVCQDRLVGLFTWRWTESCRIDTPGVYTSITFHRQWILNLLNGGTTMKPTAKPPGGSSKGTTKKGTTTKGTTKTGGTTKGTKPGIASKETTKQGVTTKGPTKPGGTTKGTSKSAGTTKGTTKKGATTKGTTKKGATTKGTTKAGGTTKGTTKKGTTAKGTTKKGATTKGTTKAGGTTKGTTKKGTTAKGTTKAGGSSKGTTRPGGSSRPTTPKPNGSSVNSFNGLVLVSALILANVPVLR